MSRARGLVRLLTLDGPTVADWCANPEALRKRLTWVWISLMVLAIGLSGFLVAPRNPEETLGLFILVYFVLMGTFLACHMLREPVLWLGRCLSGTPVDATIPHSVLLQLEGLWLVMLLDVALLAFVAMGGPSPMVDRVLVPAVAAGLAAFALHAWGAMAALLRQLFRLTWAEAGGLGLLATLPLGVMAVELAGWMVYRTSLLAGMLRYLLGAGPA